jgi:hypothetical protein
MNIRFNHRKGYMEISRACSYIRSGNKQIDKNHTDIPSIDHLCDFLFEMERRKGPASIHTTYTQSDGTVYKKRENP